MIEKPTKPPTLSEKHGKRRERRAKSSLALSVLLHGLVGAGLVGVSFYAGSPQKPRRIYELNFGEATNKVEIAEAQAEVLEPEAVPVDEPIFRDPIDATLVETPAPLPDTTLVRELFEVTPVEDWTDQQLADDFLAPDTEVTLLPATPVTPVKPAQPTGNLQEDLPEVDPADDEDPEQAERLAPKRIEGKDPAYPRLSSRLKEQGAVALRLTLDEAGRVRGVELVESSGYSRLDEAAMSAAPKWRFDLTPSDVLRNFVHTVHFKLDR